MNTRLFLINLILLAAGLLAACASVAAPTEVMVEKEVESMPEADEMMKATPTEAMMDKATPDTMMDKETPTAMMDKETPPAMTEEAMDAMSSTPSPEAMDEQGAMMEMPAWFAANLSDVRSGENFTINDLAGKVILVESMAIWCPTCLRQQMQVSELHTLLGERDDFASVGLGIDPNENAEQLKAYIESNGFDWRYAIAPVDVSREIAQLYGDQFVNPPSAPMLIIDRHGGAHPLPFGVKDAQSLMEALEPFLNEEM
jgi:cytochrome oxidase Cu insertion factor (SCO1/SenC/PrrC family)